MDLTIIPKKLEGRIQAIPSKSHAHRLLICAAFSDAPTQLYCPQINQDIEATAGCLQSLGAQIKRTADGFTVIPTTNIPAQAILDCRESGSTLRFMLPIVGALGVNGTFCLAGRLPKRPLSLLWEEMERMGCSLSRPTSDTIFCTGKLRNGDYRIDGSISSQFITGLLCAMALLPGESRLTVTGKAESIPYIRMTQDSLLQFGVQTQDYQVKGSYPFHSPGLVNVEGDWSNGAFFLAAEALGNNIDVTGLSPDSPQGDRAVTDILNKLNNFSTIDAADIPDLVPILAVTAGGKNGALFTNIARLRLKESDRVESVAAMLRKLGATVTTSENTIQISPAKFRRCTIDTFGDHRIAMAAAIAATVAGGPVTILGAECVAKSYPSFWEEYKRLGGHYEQYIR